MAATVGETLSMAVERLRRAGSETPRLDAEVLLGHVIGRDRAWLMGHPEAELTDAAPFAALLERRATGEPVAYIREFKEWHGLRLRTDPRALIPRPETELLADAVGDEVERRLALGPVVAWEVATGSGALALVVARRFAGSVRAGRLRLVASDISTDALALAAENASAHGVSGLIELVECDLLQPAGGRLPRPDVVAANLPYVSSAEVDARAGSLGFEPRVALDGGPDGLELLRRFMAMLPTSTVSGATAFLETGVGQAPGLRSILPPGARLTVVSDLAGLDRVVRIDLPGAAS